MDSHVSPTGAIQAAVEHSGKSKRQVSRDIGRTDSFLAVMTSKGHVPNADLMAHVAKACGMELQLTDGETVIAIKPSKEGK